MFKSWRLGRVFGFPVEINLSFLLLLGVVFLTSQNPAIGLLIVLLAFGSVLLHELGHALVARHYGVHVSGIELSFFGGAAKMVQMPRTAAHEIAIAAAGPAVSLMLAGLGFGLGVIANSALFQVIGLVNLVIAAFNLIPALPMDGGRILRALLTRKMSFVRATDVAVTIARGFAIVFALYGLWSATYQLVVLAPLLWMMGTRERQIAHAVADRYVGHGRGGSTGFGGFGGSGNSGDDRFGRAAGPWSRGGGFTADEGPQVRRFAIRQVGGRVVVEVID